MCWLIVYLPYLSQIPRSVAGHGPNTNHTAIIPSTRELAKLLEGSLGRTSLTVYCCPWHMLQQFIRDRQGLQIRLDSRIPRH